MRSGENEASPGLRERPPRRQILMDDPGEGTTARLYRVQEGDDLRSVARRFYGAPDYWILIYGANLRHMGRNSELRPGQILHIPEIGDDGGKLRL